MLVALALDEIGLRVLVGRPLELVPRDRELELRQVLALEERVQIRGREEDAAVALLHHGSISAGERTTYAGDPGDSTFRRTLAYASAVVTKRICRASCS